MKKILQHMTALLVSTFALTTFPAFSQEIQFSGNFTTQAGVGLPYTHDNSGDFLLGKTVFDGTVKSYLGESMFYLNGNIIYDALGSLSSNGTEALVSEDGTFALKLKEAYIDYNGGWWALRAGRQIAAWGKADSFQIADILCPQDTSSIIASDYKESRIGIDALRLSYTANVIQADAYWIPFFTPSTLPLAKGNPLNPILFPSDLEGLPINAPKNYTELEYPEKEFLNSEFAGRFSAYLSALDLSLYAFYGWDDLPFVSYNGVLDESSNLTGINVNGKYERMMMFGLDAAIPAGDFVFRLESAVFPNRYIQTNAEHQLASQMTGEKAEAGIQHVQELSLAGLDWTPGGGWTITAQYVADVLFADSDAIEKLEREQYEHQATLSVDKTLLNETLTISLSGAFDLNEFSSATELSAIYSLSDSINLSLIGNFFLEGIDGKKGKYGSYLDLSTITLKGKISF